MSTSNTHQQSLADAGSETRPLMLERGPYKFKEFTLSETEPPRMQKEEDLKGDDLKHYEAEIEAMNLILISIPNDIYNSMDACTTAQAMWQRVERLMRGTVQNKVDRETHFNNEFDQFVADPGEALVSVYNHFAQLMNDLGQNGIKFPPVTVNTKFLNCLQSEWLKYITQVRLAKRLKEDSYDDLFDYLQQFEKLINASRAKNLEKSHDPLALVAHMVQNTFEDPLTSAMTLIVRAITQRFSNPTNNRLRTSSNTRNQAIIQADRVQIQSRNSGNDGRNTRRSYVQEEVIEGTAANVQCYNCSEKGHYARNCPKPRVRDSKYFMEQMLLAKQDEAGLILTNEHNDFLFVDAFGMEELEEINNQEQKYPKQPKIINNTIGDDQIDSNIIFDEPNGDVNSGSVEYDNNVQESYELEQLAKNAYKEAEKQQIIAKKVQEQNIVLTKQLESYKEKLQHAKERQKYESSLKIVCETSWISKMEKLESENVSLEFQTYAYADVRAQNQDLLMTITELKTKMKNAEKAPKMYKVTKQTKTNTKRAKSVLPSTRLSAASSVKRSLNRDSPLKNNVLSNTKKSPEKVEVSIRTNKKTYVASKNVVSNKKIVNDMDVENALKANDVLCVSCAKNVLIPCHDKCLANYKLNVHSKVRRALFTTSRIIKSKLEDTTPVVSKTRFSVKTTQSKSLDTSLVVSKTKIVVVTPLSVKNKVSSAFTLRDNSLSKYMKNKIRTSRMWQKWYELQPNVVWSPIKTTLNVVNSRNTVNTSVVQIILWIVDSGCSKHMTGDDLLTGARESNLYTISISDIAASSSICLMSKSTSTKSWLWHHRLSHLNFGTINDLTKHDLVDGLLKFKYKKNHLCFACERGKSKKVSHPPKVVTSNHSKLELLHMDLCGPMQVASINEKRYILVIVDDYSRFTWAYFLRTKDETPEIIKNFIARVQLNYNAKVHKIRTDNDSMNIPSKVDLDNLFGPIYEEYFENRSSKAPIDVQRIENEAKTWSGHGPVVVHGDPPPLTVADHRVRGTVAVSTRLQVWVREIPSGESKVHIEVLSVLCGNKLLIPDGSLPLSRNAWQEVLFWIGIGKSNRNVIATCGDVGVSFKYKFNIDSLEVFTMGLVLPPNSFTLIYGYLKEFGCVVLLEDVIGDDFDDDNCTHGLECRDTKIDTVIPTQIHYGEKVVQIVLWIIDSGCTKHMTGDRSLLQNFVEKFIGTVRFGNDYFTAITCYGDYEQGNITISHVYYVEGLGHNLFSVRQFCDGDRESNLYTISISDIAASSHVCLMYKVTSTKSWLWHRRVSHLDFGTINDLTKYDMVDGLPKFKYGKNHLCSACEWGKSKKASHPPKVVPSNNSKLELLHMDLCGLKRVASINEKRYILVIVDDYS
ncbi:integrase, catalytic region, zinc finger, CCHC-type containing protein [Tanacetum coccineum]